MFKKNYFKNNNWADTLLIWSFISFGFFPILPNKLKGLPVVILLFTSLIICFQQKRFSNITKREVTSFLVFSGLYIMYAISVLYSDDVKTGLRRLETCAALIIIPICFLFIGKFICNKNLLKQFGSYFFWCSTLYSLSIILYFFDLGYYSGTMSLSESMSWMDHEMWLIKQHAIYASMFISIGLIFSKFAIDNKPLIAKVIAIFAIIINTYVLFLLLRKGVIIALFFALLILIFKNFKKARLKVILPLLLVIIVACFTFKDSIYERSKELFILETYEDLNTENSTSMRFVIYSCVLDEIKKSPILGYGVGDGYDLIASCLKERHDVVFKDSKEKKNSHNQYLGVLLYTGLIGLIIFLVQLFIYFKESVRSPDPLMLQFLIFFLVLFFIENLLDRQSGVIMFSFIMNTLYNLNINKSSPPLE
jgi:O-antigen ligase